MAQVIIIGSGPAGISASLYTARAGLKTTILTKGIGALDKAHMIQNYYGFAEPISGKDLAEAGVQGAKNVGVEFVDAEVVGLTFESSLVVETTEGRFPADYVVLATGTSRAAPRITGLKDFEGKGVSYCAVCDGFFYRGKDVVVLGSGEYAAHEIGALLPIAKSVTLLTNGAEPTTEFPEGVIIDKRKVTAIEGDGKAETVVFADGETIPAEGLFVAYGTAGSTDLARKIGAALEGNKILTDETMATNVPGLYAAGDCTGGMLQVAKAVYEGAKAGSEIAKASKRKPA